MSLDTTAMNHPKEVHKRDPLFRFQMFTSLSLLVLFLIVTLSGAILYSSPRGRVANWGQWTVLGWDKESWAAFHINATICFVVFSILHLLFNWKMLLGYLKRGTLGLVRGRLELLAALVFAGLLYAGTRYHVPPFSQFVAWREAFKDYWERRSPPAPIPHLEEFTLERISQLAGASEEEILQFVRSLGVEDVKSSSTLAQIAAQIGQSPRQVFDAMAQRFPSLQAIQPPSPEQRRGLRRPDGSALEGPGAFGPGSGRGGGRGMGQGLRRGRMSDPNFE
ncbi:MAG: DUF4405 domain-containing protein [Thermogutta sp.]|nr:DUF4405 domain-containing protein [Thermogutta sp.]HOP75846.1 DUF4405 domain-containing protein [Thermogutta sp.]HPU05066.1 DUF4405 domain-containing protein [Thermogutta sp.]HPZ82590.1 DUF4405 domain-containing protein [Thermogutta sp.]HQF13657.1 DUF4405 domain-containing protein [Thermogutta sp.]